MRESPGTSGMIGRRLTEVASLDKPSDCRLQLGKVAQSFFFFPAKLLLLLFSSVSTFANVRLTRPPHITDGGPHNINPNELQIYIKRRLSQSNKCTWDVNKQPSEAENTLHRATCGFACCGACRELINSHGAT